MLQSFDLVGEMADNEIHKLADKNGWQEGSAEKNALYALVGGIMSELTGNGFLAGASASTVNKKVQKKLSEQFDGEPDKHQWASAIIGGVVSQLVAGKAQAGASTAASGTKNNILSPEQIEKKNEENSELANSRNSAGQILENERNWSRLDNNQQADLVKALQDKNFVSELNEALKNNPNIDVFKGVVVRGYDMHNNIIDATNPINRQIIIQGESSFIKTALQNGITSMPDGILRVIENDMGIFSR